jgi:cytidylate kinase
MCAHVIAVDGPTAAGKTTTSRQVASVFAIPYLESGRTYRLVAYAVLQRNVDLADERSLIRICDELRHDNAYQRVLSASDHDAAFLRTPEVTRAVSPVASAPALRERITHMTRSWATLFPACVIEGRDIGTAVFPDASVKIFLTAGPEVRARRRYRQEPTQPYEMILNDLIRRDYMDESRTHAPLTPATDATVIDTSEMPVNDVVRKMVSLCVVAGIAEHASGTAPGPRRVICPK